MRLSHFFENAFEEHIPLVLVTIFALFIGLIAQWYFDTGNETLFAPRHLPEFIIIFLCAPVPVMIYRVLESLIRRKRYDEMKAYVVDVVSIHNIMRVLICFICLYAVISIFSTVKSQIGLYLTPQGHDLILIEIERFIHGGYLPHQFFMSIFHDTEARIIYKIDFFYWVWFIVLYIYLAWIVFQPPGTPGRMRYLVSFALCWTVLGNILAALLASAGPVFWEYYVDAPNPYVDILNALDAANAQEPLFRARFRDFMLWMVHNDNVVDINGPAAMPSVHVGIASLFVMHSARYLPVLAPAAITFLGLILFGSFMLAWHYAIDGYLAIAAMLLIWIVMGRWVEKERGL